jgi:hypothetical protein
MAYSCAKRTMLKLLARFGNSDPLIFRVNEHTVTGDETHRAERRES